MRNKERLADLQNCLRLSGRGLQRATITLVFFALILNCIWAACLRGGCYSRLSAPFNRPSLDSPVTTKNDSSKDTKLHFLIPSTKPNVNLCRAILTSSVLGYPSPSILAWNETLKQSDSDLLGRGSHLLKISRALSYLEALGSHRDDDLVLMIDAYDIQFQLPPNVLIQRYHETIATGNARLKAELGLAYDVENIRQRVVFGAGKRCAPQALREVSCYCVPESPLPYDIYGSSTDTRTGWNQWFSYRQRFLNSGYVIGPVGDVRRIFQRAQQIADENKDHPIWHGSDQAIFGRMLGQQHYVRELARLKHLKDWQKMFRPDLARPRRTRVEMQDVDSILGPSWEHVPFEPREGWNYEFGIELDYFSELGHQTANSEVGRDSGWLVWKDPTNFTKQIEGSRKPHKKFNCKVARLGELEANIKSQPMPTTIGLNGTKDPSAREPPRWEDVPLYTNWCLGTVPVMIHHNGYKNARSRFWKDLWIQPWATELLEARMAEEGSAASVKTWTAFKEKPGVKKAGGVWTDRDEWLDWEEICPSQQYGEELFGKPDT